MKRIFLLSTALIIICLLVSACQPDAPSIGSVENLLYENHADIQIVIDYMLSTGFNSIHITDDTGIIWADFNDVTVDSENVIKSLENLLGSGKFMHINKIENTIDFMCWSPFMKDISCGLAYSINGVDEPQIQYGTQITPLSENGWYYYVEDYEKWRNIKTGDDSVPRQGTVLREP